MDLPVESETCQVDVSVRESLSRVRNSILALSKFNMMLYDSSILRCFDYSKERFTTKEMLEVSVQRECAGYVKGLMLDD